MGDVGRPVEQKRVRVMGFGDPELEQPERKLNRKALENRLLKLAETGDPALVLAEAERFLKTRCRATTRRGTACQRKALKNGRCPNHGGMSTGPRTPAGRRRALANLKQFRSLSPAERELRLAALDAG